MVGIPYPQHLGTYSMLKHVLVRICPILFGCLIDTKATLKWHIKELSRNFCAI